MRRVFLLAALLAAGCTPDSSTLATSQATAQGPVVPSGFGDQLLDNGAVLTFERAKFALSLEEEKQLIRMLPQVRAALASMPAGQRRLCVAGHTDRVGDDEEYNKTLSLRRAQAVAERMIDFGIPIGDLVIRGYGSSKPFIEGARINPHNRIVFIARGDKCKE
jgi:outer membrane protein OmpA-like peptidoglycan-associated protein